MSKRSDIQFQYWNLRRQGQNQSSIARQFNITRQAVNKSIKLIEGDILFKLLDTAHMSGILVEWQDPLKGVLIGITPQLSNIPCIMMIDNSGQTRIFYDQTKNKDKDLKKNLMKELKDILHTCLKIEVGQKDSFRDIMKKVINS